MNAKAKNEAATEDAVASNDVLDIRFVEFNYARHARGKEAAKIEITSDGETIYLWMNKSQIRKNMELHGEHQGFKDALSAYGV